MTVVQQHTVCWFICEAGTAHVGNAAADTAAHYLRRQRVTVIVRGDSHAATELATNLGAKRLVPPAVEVDTRWSGPGNGANVALCDLLSRHDGGRIVVIGQGAVIRVALCTL